MEVVVLEDSPLAVYLEGEGREDGISDDVASSPSRTPTPSFAPRGPIKVRHKTHVLPQLWLATPQRRIASALHSIYSQTLDLQLSRADNARFLERFRYMIVASQLLNIQTYPSHINNFRSNDVQPDDISQDRSFTPAGVAVTAFFAFSLAWSIHWARGGANSIFGKGRIAVLFTVVGVVGVLSYTYFRRQWLQHIRHETLAELSNLVVAAYNIDNATASTLSLIQEVELVSRGYQIGSPLPPVSRIEDRNQTRRCLRLRKLLRSSLIKVQSQCIKACKTLQPLAERLDLEKYYDIYDISDIDLSDILSEIPETELEESESIRALKILAARYNVVRKFFLCCLMALNADENKNDLYRWNITMEEIHQTRITTAKAAQELSKTLNDDENFLLSPTKTSHTPERERWRAQSRQLNSLSSGIRGLQAKLHVLREESDKHINESDDVSELAPSLMAQYESLGADLKSLVQEWEDGKSTLASNLDRSERRKSCLSGVVSPTASLGGLTVVEEGGSAFEALKALNGEAQPRSSIDFSIPEFEEVFEAIAMPPHRGSLSREERIAKIKDDRAKRYSARYSQDNNTKIIRELESVIRMRPKNRLSVSPRVSSM